MLAEALWAEWRPHGVDVLALVLGAADTPALQRTFAEHGGDLGELAAFRAADLRITVDGQPESVSGLYVSGNLHRLLGIDAIVGRVLDPADDSIVGSGGPSGAVGIISYEYWQHRFGGRADIVGKTIQVGDRITTIVGVSGDVRHVSLGSAPRPEIFINSMQSELRWPWLVLAVRTHGDAALLVGPVKDALRTADPNVPIKRVATLESVVSRSIPCPVR